MRYTMSNGTDVTTRAMSEDDDAHREVMLSDEVIGWLYGEREGVWYGETRNGDPIMAATSHGVVREVYRRWSGNDAKVIDARAEERPTYDHNGRAIRAGDVVEIRVDGWPAGGRVTVESAREGRMMARADGDVFASAYMVDQLRNPGSNRTFHVVASADDTRL